MIELDLMKGFVSDDMLELGDKMDYPAMNKGVAEYNRDDSDEIFTSLQESKLGTIKGVIDDINVLISQREKLSSTLLKELDKMKMEIGNVLLQNQEHIKLNPELIKERMELRKKGVDLEESKVNEQVNCWRDIALLKKELRERIKEYKESENSLGLLDKIIG